MFNHLHQHCKCPWTTLAASVKEPGTKLLPVPLRNSWTTANAKVIVKTGVNCYLHNWINPKSSVVGNDVDPDKVSEGQCCSDGYLQLVMFSFQPRTTIWRKLTPTFLEGYTCRVKSISPSWNIRRIIGYNQLEVGLNLVILTGAEVTVVTYKIVQSGKENRLL